MNSKRDESQVVADLVKTVREQATQSAQGGDSKAPGCCWITLSSGKRECFDWEGLGYNECKKIGEQAGLPYQYLPGQKCP